MCFVEDFRVCQPLQTFIAEMNSIITIPLQPLNDSQVHAHVRKKSHWLLGCVHLFLGQPSRVLDCLLNIFALQIRVPLKYFVKIRAMSNLSDDDGNWNSH